jgi:Mce-associated membrane protein
VTELPASSRFRLNAVLYLLVVVALAACVVGAVFGVRTFQDRADARDSQEEYAAVMAAARDEVSAFVNIDYRDMDKAVEAVNEGATGDFKKQYDTANADLRKLLVENQSVMTGKVLHAGVVSIDGDSARVFIGTTGTVQNTSTGNKPRGREFRLQVDLEKSGGDWLTSNIVFLDGGWDSGTSGEVE